MQSNKFCKAVVYTNQASHKYIDHFCSCVLYVAWPFKESEAGEDIVLLEICMLFLHYK